MTVILFVIHLALISHHVLLREIFACIHLHEKLQNLIYVRDRAANGFSKIVVLVPIAVIRDDVSWWLPWLE